MDPRPPNITPSGEDVKWEDFGHQYKYYTEEMDPFFPDPTVNKLATTIFCDSDHAHDLVTGRSFLHLCFPLNYFILHNFVHYLDISLKYLPLFIPYRFLVYP